MRTTLVLATVALLCAGLPAQSSPKYVTAPDGYVTTLGNIRAFLLPLSFFRGGRFQHGDRAIGSGKALSLCSVSWRPTVIGYSTATGMGRTFTSLSMSMGHTDCDKWSSRFTLNYIGTGTTLFSGGITLPTLSIREPQTWGRAGTIKFSKKFLYNGKDGILQDFSNAAGTLANGYTGSHFATYYVDGCGGYASGWSQAYIGPDFANASYVPKPPDTGSSHCQDSSHGGTLTDTYTYAALTLYADNYRTTSLRCKYRATLTTYRTSPKNPVLAVLTVGGSDAGTDVGAKCNKLHANMGFPVLLSTKSPGFRTTTQHLSNSVGTYDDNAAGVTLYAQCAWQDTKGGLALSIATKLRLVKKGDEIGCSGECVNIKYLDNSGNYNTKDGATGRALRTWEYQKLDRYDYK